MSDLGAPVFDPAKLKTYRKSAGLSRQALSDLCPSVSMASICAYEYGKSIPNANALFEIASVLGLTAHHLSK